MERHVHFHLHLVGPGPTSGAVSNRAWLNRLRQASGSSTLVCSMGNRTDAQLVFRPDLDEALWAEFVAPFFAGETRYAASITLHGVKDAETLIPIDSLERIAKSDHLTSILARTQSWSAMVRRYSAGTTLINVLGADQESVAKAIAEFRAHAPGEPDSPSSVPFDFWQVSNNAYTTQRRIEAPAWAEVRQNYPEPVASEFERLMAAELSDDVGRIVLWHGPPGTGKTSAIRALAREWRTRKRQFQVILDPESIFARSSLLMEVLLGDEDSAERWRVLVVEDADELLRSDAKDRVGQALSRLLNVGDGIVGQGIKTLVLITTNEPIRKLHPALVPPAAVLPRSSSGSSRVPRPRSSWAQMLGRTWRWPT